MNKWNVKCVILAVLAIVLLSSCFQTDFEVIEIEGTWDMGFGMEMVVEGDTWISQSESFAAYDLTGKIVSFSNDSFNTASENPDAGVFGHMVIKITAGGESVTGQIGEFKIVRWQDLKTVEGVTTLESSQGYKEGFVFTSEDEVVDGATSADGFFGFYSVATLK